MSRLTCEECGDKFDPRSLTEVAIHMHDGFVPSGDIIGERVDETPARESTDTDRREESD